MRALKGLKQPENVGNVKTGSGTAQSLLSGPKAFSNSQKTDGKWKPQPIKGKESEVSDHMIIEPGRQPIGEGQSETQRRENNEGVGPDLWQPSLKF